MNSDRRSVFSNNLGEPKLTALKGLETRLDLDHREDFKKAYGNLLCILNTEVNTTVVHPLRCFTLRDHQLAPTLE